MTTHLQAQFYEEKTEEREKRLVASVWQSEMQEKCSSQGPDKESDKCKAEIPNRRSTEMDTSPVG